jgi:hypothetical protein
VDENGVGRGKRRKIDVEVEFDKVIKDKRKRIGKEMKYEMDMECKVEE